MDIGGDGTAWLVAITGAVTGIGALILNRRSQKETAELTRAANRVARDRSRLEETEQAITSLERALERANEEIDRLSAARTRAEAERDEAKDLHRQMYAAQESRCREFAQDLTDAILVLRRVVRDEVAREAADAALEWPGHPHLEEESSGDDRGSD